MDPISAALIVKALDALTLRANITAQNIANANTADYRAMHVSFEESLAAAAAGGSEAIDAVRPRVDHASGAEGEPGGMRLDLEIARAASTAARYSALIEMLNRQMQIQALAVSGGQ